MRADEFVQMRCKGVGRKLEPSFRLRTFAANDGSSALGNLQHRRVFAQCMDEESVDAAIARMQNGVLEEAPTEATPSCRRYDRYPELGHLRLIGRSRRHWMRKVRHGQEFEPAVEDAEYFVAVEVERIDVLGDLGVGRGVTESQVAGVRVQSEKVSRDSFAMAWSERTNGNPRPVG